MKLAVLEERLSENLKRLEEAKVRRLISYRVLREKYPKEDFLHEINRMERAAGGIELFHQRLDTYALGGILQHPSSERILAFSARVCDGARTSIAAIESWVTPGWNAAIRSIATAVSSRYARNQEQRQGEQLKTILAFQYYGAAHVVFRDLVDEFAELLGSACARQVDLSLGYLFQTVAPENVFSSHANFLRPLRHEAGIDTEYVRFMDREGPFYTA